MSLPRLFWASKRILRMQSIDPINGLVKRLGVLLEFWRRNVNIATDDGDLFSVEGMRVGGNASP